MPDDTLLDDILSKLNSDNPSGSGDADDIPDIDESSPPICQIGDLWILGGHRLLCGDASKSSDVERLMDGKKADMCFTDPPYGVAYVGKTKNALTIENDSLSPDDLKVQNKLWFDSVDIALRDGAYVIATVPAGPLHLIFAQDWVDRGWLRQIMVWNKDSMVLGHSEYHYKHEPILFGWKPGERLKNTDRTKTTVWDFDRPKRSLEHPTMKNVQMWIYGINQHTKKKNIVFEPFSGSGTSFIACEEIGRFCYGLELSQKYCDVIINRWQNYTGRQAVHAETGLPFNPQKTDPVID